MLALGVAAQAAGTVFVSTPAFLIPLLHAERGISLVQAGLLASAPTIGMVLTLVAWGALADRFGERRVITTGLALTAVAAVGAAAAGDILTLWVFFFLGGAVSASTNAASGRVVVGWFPRERRGFAMGIRQMSQPLGVTVAALAVPGLAAEFGIGAAVALSLVLNAALAVLCAVGLADPVRPVAAPPGIGVEPDARPAANPYRASSFLWRIHLVSALLVVPQFALSIFGIVWLVAEMQWSAPAAGLLIGVAQFIGAVGRIGVGELSDRVGSRVRVLRWVAVSGCLVMLVVGATGLPGWSVVAGPAFIVATLISVADNGLAFTSVAEAAGASWAGKAFGIQNTGQYVVAAMVGPLVGGLVTLVGYPLAFVAIAIAPAAVLPLIPKADAARES
ncbi:MFS transporter [Agromyces aureus]|uniref:MFS transporter n=2 Tax=Agromyces aureus TaxID=453304 RepID=A0A191WLL7_9MICO|nr:MFS transporter [Agromyces aureus]